MMCMEAPTPTLPRLQGRGFAVRLAIRISPSPQAGEG